jgi:histidinol-phosphate/aromatic aminotransferase/cobyric acid decarboxylase-like protein
VTFREFQAIKATVIAEKPTIRNLAEHDIAKAFAGERRIEPALEAVHRCDLSRFWLEAYALPIEWRKRVLISGGVRHSLRLLFGFWAKRGKRALLPQDVYPAYGRIACEERLAYDVYATAERIVLHSSDADIMLVPNPVEPRGDYLRQEEIEQLIAWAGHDPNRRIVIDGVYHMQTTLDMASLQLLGTGQAIYVTSLSKLWASPGVLGVTVVPPDDLDALFESFAASENSQEHLRFAANLLRDGGGTARTVATGFAVAKQALRASLTSERIEVSNSASGYHTLLNRPWQQLLHEHSMLAIPFDVFGGHPMMSVATPLSFVPRREVPSGRMHLL